MFILRSGRSGPTLSDSLLVNEGSLGKYVSARACLALRVFVRRSHSENENENPHRAHAVSASPLALSISTATESSALICAPTNLFFFIGIIIDPSIEVACRGKVVRLELCEENGTNGELTCRTGLRDGCYETPR